MNTRSYRQWKRENRRRKRVKKRKIFPVVLLTVVLLIGTLIGGTVVFLVIHSREATIGTPEVLSGVVEFRIVIHIEECEEVIAEHMIDNPSSTEDRNVNLRCAAEILNGYRVEPGETFSWLQAVGNPTVERGFREAAEIAMGEGTKGIGGGICQVSSTINSAIQKTEQRTDKEYFHAERHSTEEPPAYLKPKRGDKEASVAFSSQKDFWFKNSLKYPIRMEVVAVADEVTVKIITIRKKLSVETKVISKGRSHNWLSLLYSSFIFIKFKNVLTIGNKGAKIKNTDTKKLAKRAQNKKRKKD